ncbi:MAG TPA: macro domain-containing protein [Acidilobales archaeon]|nr:MAG: O-acetyl-ADP-ribose deacetylase [Desulfurococcales archaeon ex4484_42]HDN76176.1 macro domain-containing protein [Acidilobales archaeon]
MGELCEYVYGGVTVKVLIGDITKVHVDAVVNPANSLMIMGGGVAGALRRVGGDVIEEEARRYAPVPVGKAVVTTAGKLPVKYVIHSPTMERPAMRTTTEKVRLATRAALEKANELGIKSIAFPGMGTGVGGLSYSEAAEVMVSTIKEFINAGTTLKEMLLVAIDEALANEFCKSLSIST